MKWPTVPLGQLVTLQRGYDLPEYLRQDGDIPVVTSSGITGYHSQAGALGPGVLTGRYGTIGEVHYVEGDYWPHNTTLFVREFKGNEPLFVRYLLISLNLANQVSSGAVPGVNRNVLHTMLVPEVPVSMQRRIALMLFAYDSLMQNNLRRIKLLEELARLLYKEWFIRLRFPAHEHTRIVNGVPEAWERVSLKDLCESIDYGFTASAQEEEVGPKLLRITDIVPPIVDWSSVPYCEIPDGKREKYLLKQGDIVVARTGATVGYAKRLHRRHPQAIFASYLVRLRILPDVDNILVGIFVESDYYKTYVKAQIGGAAQPNANAQVLTRATLLLPPANIQKWFREIEEPLFDHKELLQVQNQKLRQARDILLPKLMSGEIKV